MGDKNMYEHFTGSGYAVSEEIVYTFETEHTLRLPPEYRDFLLRFNGGDNGEYFRYVRIIDRHPPLKPAFDTLAITYYLPLTNETEENIETAYADTQQYSQLRNKYLMVSLSGGNWSNILIGIHQSNYGQVFFWDKMEQEARNRKTPLIVYLCHSWNDFFEKLMTDAEAKAYVQTLKKKYYPELTTALRKDTRPETPTAAGNAPLSPEEAAAFEKRIGYVLPDDYRHFLETDNGTLTTRKYLSFFDIVQQHDDSIVLQFYIVGNQPNSNDLEYNYTAFIQSFYGVQHLLPIGGWEGGDYVCLDLSKEKFGKIFFVMHDYWADEDIYRFSSPVADSFHELLSKLKTVEETP